MAALNVAFLASIPKPIQYGIPIGLILIGAVVIVASLVSGNDTRAVQQASSAAIVRMCTKCGEAFEDSPDQAGQKGYLDLEGTSLTQEGKYCPQCKEHSVTMAVKCPKDGTIFVPDTSQGFDHKDAWCPTCGWDPASGGK